MVPIAHGEWLSSHIPTARTPLRGARSSLARPRRDGRDGASASSSRRPARVRLASKGELSEPRGAQEGGAVRRTAPAVPRSRRRPAPSDLARIVFVWFGLLKVFDVSPVSALVAKTIYWFGPDVVVPALGVFEVFVGVCLMAGRLMRIALPLLVLQMAGTFLVLVMHPDVAFATATRCCSPSRRVRDQEPRAALGRARDRLAARSIGEMAPAPEDAERLGSSPVDTTRTVDVDLAWIEELTKRETAALDEACSLADLPGGGEGPPPRRLPRPGSPGRRIRST